MSAIVVSVLKSSVFVDFLRLSNLLSVLLDGLSLAAVYILIAMGLTLIFGLMHVLNFAHGSLTMIGAFLGGTVMVTIVSATTSGPVRLVMFFIGLVVVFCLMSALGIAIERTLIRPLYDGPEMNPLLLTLGLVLIFDEVMRIAISLAGRDPDINWQAALGTRPGFLQESVGFGGVSVRALGLFEIVIGVAIIAAVWVLLTKTRIGMTIRAGSEDSEMTAALGYNVKRLFTIVFGIGVGLAGIAGMLLMWDPRWGANVPLAIETLLPAFVIVIIGGLGTFRGTIAAGILVGIVDATMTSLFQKGVGFSGLPDMMIFILLVIVLLIQPQGLYGTRGGGVH